MELLSDWRYPPGQTPESGAAKSVIGTFFAALFTHIRSGQSLMGNRISLQKTRHSAPAAATPPSNRTGTPGAIPPLTAPRIAPRSSPAAATNRARLNVAEPVYMESWVPALKKAAHDATEAGKSDLKKKLVRILPEQTADGVKNLMLAAHKRVPAAIHRVLDVLDDFSVFASAAANRAEGVTKGLQRCSNEPGFSPEVLKRIASLRMSHQLRCLLAPAATAQQADGLRALVRGLHAAPASAVPARYAMAWALIQQLAPEQNAALVRIIGAVLRQERDGAAGPTMSGNAAVMALLAAWGSVADGRAADIDAFANALARGDVPDPEQQIERLRALETNLRELPKVYGAAADELQRIRQSVEDGAVPILLPAPLRACADRVRALYSACPTSAAWRELQALPRELHIDRIAEAPAEGTIKRAPVDILIHWASHLDQQLADGDLAQAHAGLLSAAKAAFFSGTRSAEDIKMVLNDAAQYCTDNNLGAHRALLDVLIPQLPDGAYIAQLQSQRTAQVLDEWEKALSASQEALSDVRQHPRKDFFSGEQLRLRTARAGTRTNEEIMDSLMELHDACRFDRYWEELHDLRMRAGELAAEIYNNEAVCLVGPLLQGAAAARVFETAFAEAWLGMPMPDSFGRSMDRIAARLKMALQQAAPDGRNEVLDDLTKFLQTAALFAHGKTASPLKEFAEAGGGRERALERFLDEKKADGRQCAALMYVGRNIIDAAYPDGALTNPPWIAERDAYEQTLPETSRIKGENVMIGSALRNAHAAAGLTLPFQPAVARIPGAVQDKRPVTRYNPDFGFDPHLRPSAPVFEHASNSGEIHVASISGSAGTLLHMLDAYRQVDPAIDVRAGVVAMAMYMIHMGGHSLYESMWVVHDLQAKLGLDVGHTDGDGNFVMDIGKLLHISDDPAWIGMLENAAQAGWDKAIAYHRQHSEFRVRQI
jgi:hypothetical protein